MRRGVIFTIDLLLSVSVLTAIIAFAFLELEEVNSRSMELNFRATDRIANDLANFAVKSVFVEKIGDTPMTNLINSKSTDFQAKISRFYTEAYKMTAKTRYSIGLAVGGQPLTQIVCEKSPDVAVAKRLVVDMADNTTKWFEVKVCD